MHAYIHTYIHTSLSLLLSLSLSLSISCAAWSHRTLLAHFSSITSEPWHTTGPLVSWPRRILSHNLLCDASPSSPLLSSCIAKSPYFGVLETGSFRKGVVHRSLGNGACKNGVRNRCPYRRCGVDTEIRIGFPFGENSAGFCKSVWLPESILNFRIGSVSSIGGWLPRPCLPTPFPIPRHKNYKTWFWRKQPPFYILYL